MKILRISLFCVLALSLFACSITSKEKEDSTMNTKQKQSTKEEKLDFSLEDLQGNKVSLADFKGEKVYIKFWASWCPICLGGLEDIQTFSQENNDFVVLSIVATEMRGEKNKEEFKTWFKGVDTNKINVLFDDNGTLNKKLSIKGYPTSLFVTPESTLFKIQPGHLDNKAIKEIMNDMI